ncbi:unnamed protein product [Didymodactylos carnosus]|uniref:Uncharacterized protein n=1 Tax=Didymodactylos carnosus TaxID=1234261 RepID=A0A813NPU2_9BILA|nr:unnamed protein product [Didymodactylos carnosus]CAF0808667.1 unnamed protein product [Didymodactylos carnosus]CAF3521378.1 unnamed protein product [Didymodactylos carnosus]CAF3592445.1 unnamed protein product [Didymodactylos carnosus]
MYPTCIFQEMILDISLPLYSKPIVDINSSSSISATTYVQYKLVDHHYKRIPLVSFIHKQPTGTQLPIFRYYRIVFHCNILPGSIYLRVSNIKPKRTVVLNRQDSSTIFGFRSVGAYSRVQIQNYQSGLWLCMNSDGRIIQKLNISLDSLTCTFRQNTDGLYQYLISELYPQRKMSFSTLTLLNNNPILKHRYENHQQFLKRERCDRFLFDQQVDSNLFQHQQQPLTYNKFNSYRYSKKQHVI